MWLYVSFIIYFFLIIALIIAIIFNYVPLYAESVVETPNTNQCPECLPATCTELVLDTCPFANVTMDQLSNPNTTFNFYMVSAVSQSPDGDPTSIASYRSTFSLVTTSVDSRMYHPLENISSGATWHYSAQLLNFVQTSGYMRISSVAITDSPNYFNVVMTGEDILPLSTTEGTVEYDQGHIVYTDPALNQFYLYAAEEGVEITLNLPDGFYPVWTDIAPTAIGTDNYFKYVWSLYGK